MANRNAGSSLFLAILAIIFIILGLAFLFQNFGLLRWGVVGTLWRLWPVLLLVAGIYIILGRSRPALAVGLSLIAVVVAFALSWALGGPPGNGRTVNGSFSQPLGNLARAEVTIAFGAGELSIDSLPPSSAELVEGKFEHQGLAQGIDQSLKVEDSLGRLQLDSPHPAPSFIGDFRQNWQVRLTSRIPLDLTIKAGASKGQLNLTDLRVSRLRLDIGASKATINLPKANSGIVEALVKAGAADLTLVVPPGTAARIKADIGLASFRIDEKRFPKTGDFFASPDFARAGSWIELEIASGLAKIEIK